MKRGGQVIYSGPLGRNSHKIIEYFEVIYLPVIVFYFMVFPKQRMLLSNSILIQLLQAIPGVLKIKPKYNPATWMLEVSSIAAEVRLKMDFAEHYKSSSLHQ